MSMEVTHLLAVPDIFERADEVYELEPTKNKVNGQIKHPQARAQYQRSVRRYKES